MSTVRSRFGALLAATVVAATMVPGLHGQTTTMPSTQRYGSGILDIPVASVLPHLAITGTYSGFFVDIPRSLQIDGSGTPVGFGPGVEEFYQDASVAVGLFDRAEVGATLQSFNDDNAGGSMLGAFGRIAILRPTNQGLGLAVGGRYVQAPDFGTATELQPGRLGFPDRRIRSEYTGGLDDVNTELSGYAVATAQFRGFEQDFLPEHDFSASLGYGTGMFQDGEDLSFYNFASSNGWFFGSTISVGLSDNALLHLMGDYNGFDVNLGAQVDVNGFRVGAHMLGMNHGEPAAGYYSQYRSRKFGVLGSVAFCPTQGGLCAPSLMERPEPETVQLPAPPPDTVRITREVPEAMPDGTPGSVCIATGEAVEIRITAQGDTLVGPRRESIADLRPGVVFAGTYAAGASWYEDDESSLTFEDREYGKTDSPQSLDCGSIMRVGEYEGVPLFAMQNADRPFESVFVPVRPGIWHEYQFGLNITRGQ